MAFFFFLTYQRGELQPVTAQHIRTRSSFGSLFSCRRKINCSLQFDNCAMSSDLKESNLSSGPAGEHPSMDHEKSPAAIWSPEDHSNNVESQSINEKALLRKLDLRLLPGLTVLYLLSFLDRSNGMHIAVPRAGKVIFVILTLYQSAMRVWRAWRPMSRCVCGRM